MVLVFVSAVKVIKRSQGFNAGFVGLLAGWVAFQVAMLVAAIPSIVAGTVALGAMVLAAAPFIAVGALVGGIFLLWQNNTLGFRDFFLALPDDVSRGLDVVKAAVSGFATDFVNGWSIAKTGASDLFEATKLGATWLLERGKDVFTDVTLGATVLKDSALHLFDDARIGASWLIENGNTIFTEASKGAATIGQYLTDFTTAVTTLVTDVLSLGSSIGSNLWKGFLTGLDSMWNDVQNKIGQLGEDIYNGMAEVLGIQSPSTKFKYLAEMSLEGYTMPFDSFSIDSLLPSFSQYALDTPTRSTIAPMIAQGSLPSVPSTEPSTASTTNTSYTFGDISVQGMTRNEIEKLIKATIKESLGAISRRVDSNG
jgi:hypothetical protein